MKLQLASFLLLYINTVSPFQLTPNTRSNQTINRSKLIELKAETKEVRRKRRTQSDAELANLLVDEETAAGVEGAQFFGGNQIKADLFDPEEEALATETFEADLTSFARFETGDEFFSDDRARDFALKLQLEFNRILYEEDDGSSSSSSSMYSKKCVWEKEFNVESTNPLEELRSALEFYRQVDGAVLTAKTLSENTFQIRWVVSVTWPNLWSSKVNLSGTSVLTLNGEQQIIKQVDTPDHPDLLKCINDQISPRFWDAYHVGMAPSTEELTRLPPPSNLNKSLFSGYQLFQIPSRLVLKPTLVDTLGREGRNAQALPPHAFATAIITTGPKRQRYTPVSPLEVQIKDLGMNMDGRRQSRIEWTVPIAVELLSNPLLPKAEPDETDPEGSSSDYMLEEKRLVATVPFAGEPQDDDVAKVRKLLYERVVKDGLKPKVDDETGKPIFFFLQNDAKACYVNEGLGMCIYEQRPRIFKGNEIGIELMM